MAERQGNGFTEVMEALMGGMDKILSTKTVVGEPTAVGDAVIVPLVDVSVGAGAGSSLTDKKSGGGGGFSAKLSPTAILMIRDGVTKVINIRNQDPVTKAIDLVPDLVNHFLAGQEDLPDKKEAMDIAFPEDDQ